MDSKGALEQIASPSTYPFAYNIFVDDRVNVEKGTVTITDPPPGMVNKVIVNYGRKALPQQVVAEEPYLIAKFGVKVQSYNMYNLNEAEAQAFADNTLKKAVRDNGFSIDLTAVGVPFYTTNIWCRTILTRYGIDDFYFISKLNLKIDNKKAPRAEITLTEYYPDISLTNTDDLQSDIANLSNTSNATIDQIGQAESKFRDVQGVCSALACFVATGRGDCWADSYWLYDQLSKAGVKVRIVCCNTGDHRWVQIDTGSGWQNWNYKKYNSQHHGPEGCHSGAGDYHVLPGHST